MRRLLPVPLSFVSDHIETLNEVDMFIESLARLVERHLDAS